jgi:DNA polymerase III epsilon subunit-like protein
MVRTALAAALLAGSPALAQQNWPAQDPDGWRLAIIDVETTGLEPGFHEMIDIGAIYTTLDGEETGRFFIRIRPDHPERAGEIARGINGYSQARWERLKAASEADAVAAFLAFHEAHAGEAGTLFTAYNAAFDRNFLDALLEEHGSDFSALYTYFLLDLPSMAWGAGVTDLSNAAVARRLGLEPETDDPLEHTGISGAQWNLELYRALRGVR